MQLNTFLKQPFNYFDSKRNKRLYVFSSTIFALVFLVLFQPYGISEEVSNPVNSIGHIFLFFISITFSTFITLFVSQFYARKWFGFDKVSVKRYLVWFLFEAMGLTLVSFIMSFIVPDLGDDFEKELNLIFQIQIFFKIIIVLLFPFVGTIIYILIENLNYEINELGDQLKAFKNKFSPSQKAELLELKDENGNLDLSIELKDFLYAESSNQYILIHYIKDDFVKKHIIRNRMKNFLTQIENLPIKQCHRSYVVNLLSVKHKVKNQGKPMLVMSYSESIKIPVSKSYLPQINALLV